MPIRLFLACLSGILLSASYPRPGWYLLAWIALVPWFFLLPRLTKKAAFGYGCLTGFTFFLLSIHWLRHVTVLGWILLCGYLALYFALMGWGARRWGFDASGIPRTANWLLTLPAFWVLLEVIRSWLFSGFGWNLLGYSQTPWPLIIQTADVWGAYGISFLVFWINAAIFLLVYPKSGQKKYVALTAAAFLAIVVVYGAAQLRVRDAEPMVKVALVQGNIAQEKKWDPAFRSEILRQYSRLTTAAAASEPHVIVWPETSVPGFLGSELDLDMWSAALRRQINIPMLIGAPRVAEDGIRQLNSAVLLNDHGGQQQAYDKLRLVPFGEFVPFENLVPWLRLVLPPIGTFSPGEQVTVFDSVNEAPFSVLVCFEDVFPALARAFRRNGAQWLMVLTNDAWFGNTGAGFQHAQASVMRAVENRVPVVRAANTGVTGCIAPTGAWIDQLKDASGHSLFIEGWLSCELPPAHTASLYLALGPFIPLGFGLLAIAGLLLDAGRRSRYNRAS